MRRCRQSCRAGPRAGDALAGPVRPGSLCGAVGDGVIGNTAGSGPAIGGSSPPPRTRRYAAPARGTRGAHLPRSSSGLGRHPLKVVARVQIPYGVPRSVRRARLGRSCRRIRGRVRRSRRAGRPRRRTPTAGCGRWRSPAGCGNLNRIHPNLPLALIKTPPSHSGPNAAAFPIPKRTAPVRRSRECSAPTKCTQPNTGISTYRDIPNAPSTAHVHEYINTLE